jgi:hypothetical protein
MTSRTPSRLSGLVFTAFYAGLAQQSWGQNAEAPLADTLKYGQALSTVHRRDAGTPDKDGWVLAKSTDGGFSVRFPARFTDATVNTIADDGTPLKMYVLTSVAEGGTQFFVQCFERADSKILGDGVATILTNLRQKAQQFRSSELPHGALVGSEFNGIDKNGPFAGEAFQVTPQLCFMLARFSSTQRGKVPEDVRKSLTSFKPRPTPGGPGSDRRN